MDISLINPTIRRDKRTKNAKIIIKDNSSVVISVPVYFSDIDCKKLFNSNIGFITNTLQKFDNQKKEQDSEIAKLESKILFFGDLLNLERGRSCELKNRTLVYDSDIALSDFLKCELRGYVYKKVDEYSKKMGAREQSINFKKLKSIWGSRSANNSLSFNYKLIFAPKSAIDYVVVHELAHIFHMNHSKSFWKLVSKHNNDKEESKLWFKNNRKKIEYCSQFIL